MLLREDIRKFHVSENFYFKCWADQCVAYHKATGETHLLEALSACIIQQLPANTPISFDALHQNILQSSDDNYSTGLLDTYLRQLTLLGIVSAERK